MFVLFIPTSSKPNYSFLSPTHLYGYEKVNQIEFGKIEIHLKQNYFIQLRWHLTKINSNRINSYNSLDFLLNSIEPNSISFNWNEIQPNQFKLVHWIFKWMQMKSLEFELNLSSIQIQFNLWFWLNWIKIKIQFNLDCNLWNSWAL